MKNVATCQNLSVLSDTRLFDAIKSFRRIVDMSAGPDGPFANA